MERASSGWAAFSPDNAIMELDNAFTQRQAKTETIDLPDQAIIHTIEAIKDALKVLGRNPQAVITHTDFEARPGFRATVGAFLRCASLPDAGVSLICSGPSPADKREATGRTIISMAPP
jgi:hypothetical protein